jgi:hypothetical protein
MTWFHELGPILASTLWVLSFVLTYMGCTAIVSRRVQLTRKKSWTGWKACAVGLIAVVVGLAIIVLGSCVTVLFLRQLVVAATYREGSSPPASSTMAGFMAGELVLLWLLGLAATVFGLTVILNRRIQFTNARLLTSKNATTLGAIISIVGLILSLSAHSIALH